MGDQTRSHWDGVYGTQSFVDVSWYQEVPAMSLRLVTSVASVSDAVVDVGAGASFLVDRLVDNNYEDVTVLDISAEALAAVRSRLTGRAGVHFVAADLFAWAPTRQYNVWHDRAVFHFLTESAAISAYLRVAAAALRTDGVLVVGTFAEDGPATCSGLPTARYSPQSLAASFAESFIEEHREREEHVTPAGIVQPFTWMVLRRT